MVRLDPAEYKTLAIGKIGVVGIMFMAFAASFLILLGIVLILLTLARRKQQKIDDRRTSIDMLEQGRLTPVQTVKPLPMVPESPNSTSSPSSGRSGIRSQKHQSTLRTAQANEPIREAVGGRKLSDFEDREVEGAGLAVVIGGNTKSPSPFKSSDSSSRSLPISNPANGNSILSGLDSRAQASGLIIKRDGR